LLTKLARTDRGLLSDLETLPVNIQICDSNLQPHLKIFTHLI